jgi:hypothetical protein
MRPKRRSPDFVKLLIEITEKASKGQVLGAFALYPPLRAFVDRFGATPELLVETYRTLVGLEEKGSTWALNI